MRPPTDIVDQAISALDADEARIAAILADEPYAGPPSRNPATIARAMIDRFQRQQTEIEDAAARAMAGAIAARAALSLWDRLLPWSTTRKRMAEAARIDADRAQTALAAARADLDDRLRRTRRAADLVAARRRAERKRWLERPDVEQVRREDLLNRDVRRRIVTGDRKAACLVASGRLANARDLVGQPNGRPSERVADGRLEPSLIPGSAPF